MRSSAQPPIVGDAGLDVPALHWTLTFHGKVEALYRDEIMREQAGLMSLTFLICLLLCNSYLANDYFVMNNDFMIFVVSRLYVATPICLLLIYAIRKQVAYQLSISLIPLVQTVTLSGAIMLGHGAYRTNYLFGEILLMISGCVMGRLCMSYAMVSVALQCLCFFALLFLTDVVQLDGRFVAALYCLSGATVALLSSYALEFSSRRAFLLGMRNRLLNETLARSASTDALTGLGNRRAFEDAIEAFWSTASRGAIASLILIDVDFFKSFNDNYGHPAGDACLIEIGRCILSQRRIDQEVVARFGGEEFIVFLPDTDIRQARVVAERIRQRVSRAAVPHPVNGPDDVVTVSLGIATAHVGHSKVADLIKRADQALYGAKRNGRNQVGPPLDPGFDSPELRIGRDVGATAMPRAEVAA